MKRRLPFLAVALFCALGCERIALIKKCRALAQRVNPELDAIAESVEGKRDAAGYQAMSGRLTAIAKELDGFDAGAPDVERAVSDYAGTLRAGSRHAAELAQAIDGGHPESAALATRELEQETKRQKTYAKRFRQECQGN